MNKEAKVVGISGPSRSGKSTLAKQLIDSLKPKKVLILDMDDYVLPAASIPKIKDRTDWERPESVDYERMIEVIENKNSEADFIIVEGILVFAHQELSQLFDFSILVKISKETFLERRSKETRWGDEPFWYLEHIWDSWLKYGQNIQPDIRLSGEDSISDHSIKLIVERLA